MEIGKAIRLARIESAWSITRLAYEAGVTEGCVYKWESGRITPGGDKLEILRAKMPALRRILDAQASSIRVDDDIQLAA